MLKAVVQHLHGMLSEVQSEYDRAVTQIMNNEARVSHYRREAERLKIEADQYREAITVMMAQEPEPEQAEATVTGLQQAKRPPGRPKKVA
jgi:hypothetical protein